MTIKEALRILAPAIAFGVDQEIYHYMLPRDGHWGWTKGWWEIGKQPVFELEYVGYVYPRQYPTEYSTELLDAIDLFVAYKTGPQYYEQSTSE